MKKLVMMLLFLLALFFVSGCIKQMQEECKKDDECVKVQLTCCPCSMGGEEACVPKINASAYIPKNCPPADKLMCIALYACKIEKCVCEEGKCKAKKY